MSLSRPLDSRGFTFIELMIAMVVLAIMLAIALPSYAAWIKNTHIRNAAESLQNGLQRARAEAVVRNRAVSFNVPGAGNFLWTVSDVATAEIIASKAAGETSPDVTLSILPAGATTVVFGNLGTVTNAAAAITQIDIDSTGLSAADSRDLRILVGVGGSTRMCDPDPGVGVTDPRYC